MICNVTQQDDVDGLIAAAEKSMNGIDVVINNAGLGGTANLVDMTDCLLYTSPSPRDKRQSRMPSSA